MDRHRYFFQILAFTFIVSVGLMLGMYIRTMSTGGTYPEIGLLKKKNYDFGELSVFFTKLSEKKGAVYAFNVLKVAPVKPDIDMHLLGHVVGDILYKQKGIEGITDCTQDFRNACSHSIVVGYFLAHGESGLSKIAETCRKAPGGVGAYTMCFHGLGHGVLAYVDYELPRAIALCEKTGTLAYGFREAPECVGGIIMEIISGGFHNKKLWEVATKRYLKTDDPTYPCSSDLVQPQSKGQCYEYITPHLIQVAGGSLEHMPESGAVSKAFSYCKNVVGATDQAFCYRGFGKEFIVAVRAKDIRSFDDMSDSQMRSVYALCDLAEQKEGSMHCITHAVDSLYWGGENDAGAAIRFCGQGQNEETRNGCFHHLIGAVHFFVQDLSHRQSFCARLPSAYQEFCVAYEK